MMLGVQQFKFVPSLRNYQRMNPVEAGAGAGADVRPLSSGCGCIWN